MQKLERNHFFEVSGFLRRNVEIFQSNCIALGHPLLISGVGEVAINLRECVEIFEKHGLRCRATHDLSPGINDVAHAVVKLRHSFCHSSTTRIKDMDENSNRLSWGFVFGQGTLIQIGDKSIGNPHADDMGVCMGETVVLLKRHIMLCHNYYCRALELSDAEVLRTATQIFADPVVERHPFWQSEENDLLKASVVAASTGAGY